MILVQNVIRNKIYNSDYTKLIKIDFDGNLRKCIQTNTFYQYVN